MPFELTAALLVALAVGVWRLLRRPTGSRSEGPLPDVGDAPPNATSISSPRWNDDGVGAYDPAFPTNADPVDRRSTD